MAGRRISKEEFEQNYTKAPRSGPEHRRRMGWARREKVKEKIKPIEYEEKNIRAPIYLHYVELCAETPKAYRFLFKNKTKEWLPKSHCRVYRRINVIALPSTFVNERNLWEFQI